MIQVQLWRLAFVLLLVAVAFTGCDMDGLNPPGRYQVVFGELEIEGEGRAKVGIRIDTKTGKTWKAWYWIPPDSVNKMIEKVRIMWVVIDELEDEMGGLGHRAEKNFSQEYYDYLLKKVMKERGMPDSLFYAVPDSLIRATIDSLNYLDDLEEAEADFAILDSAFNDIMDSLIEVRLGKLKDEGIDSLFKATLDSLMEVKRGRLE